MAQHASACALFALVFGGVTGCSSNDDTSAHSQPGSCAEQFDTYAARIAECRPITEEQRQAAIAQCESAAATADPHDAWRPEFRARVDDCSSTLTCEQYVEDLDDICFPPALAAGAAGLVNETTNAACVASSSTDACEQELALDRETGTSVVSGCFRRWAECADQRSLSEPYWTEDYCGTLIALTDEHRAQAEPCIELACAEVVGCLISAGAFNF